MAKKVPFWLHWVFSWSLSTFVTTFLNDKNSLNWKKTTKTNTEHINPCWRHATDVIWLTVFGLFFCFFFSLRESLYAYRCFFQLAFILIYFTFICVQIKRSVRTIQNVWLILKYYVYKICWFIYIFLTWLNVIITISHISAQRLKSSRIFAQHKTDMSSNLDLHSNIIIAFEQIVFHYTEISNDDMENAMHHTEYDNKCFGSFHEFENGIEMKRHSHTKDTEFQSSQTHT